MIGFLKPAAPLAAISFALHLVWEKAHIVLYTSYESLEGVLPIYVLATFGDVLYTGIGAGIAAMFGIRIFRDTRLRTYIALAGIGFCIALFVEAKAMWLNRWEYTDAMPLIYGFGLSPLVQMTVLLPLSVWITVTLVRRFNI